MMSYFTCGMLLGIAFLLSPGPGNSTLILLFVHAHFSPFAYPLYFLPPQRQAGTTLIPPFPLFNFWILPPLMLRQSQPSCCFFSFSTAACIFPSSVLMVKVHVLSGFSACHLNFLPPPAVLSPLVLLILPLLLYHTILPPPVHQHLSNNLLVLECLSHRAQRHLRRSNDLPEPLSRFLSLCLTLHLNQYT